MGGSHFDQMPRLRLNDPDHCHSFESVYLVPEAMPGRDTLTPPSSFGRVFRRPDEFGPPLGGVRFGHCFGGLTMELFYWIIDWFEDLLPLIEIGMEG